MLARISVVAVAIVAALLVGSAQAARDETRLVTLPTGTDGGANNAASTALGISADGRYVVFYSDSDNIAANDNDMLGNVYVRDLVTRTTTLVSLPTGADGTTNDDHSADAGISANGRYVAFESDADNMAANDNNGFTNVYVRDLIDNPTELVSLPTGTDGTGNTNDSTAPSLSASGRYVAFQSASTNMATNDAAVRNVYVRDRLARTTTLVSLPTGNDGTSNDAGSSNPAISADGRYVAFDSLSDNLATNDNNAQENVYVRDVVGESTTLVSLPTGTDGSTNNAGSFVPDITADGRYVVFISGSDNLAANDNDAVTNVYRRDILNQATTLVSLPDGTSGAGNNATSTAPLISGDGRYVAFESASDNLATSDNDGVGNVYVRDVVALATTLVSLPTGTSGAANNGSSIIPRISADGRYVAFSSSSDNLAANDNDGFQNSYVRTFLLDPPRNVTAPQVTGAPVVGQQLTCSDGTWTDGTLTRVWRRNGSAIGGATGTTYTLTAADVGTLVDCLVTATNADGSASAASNALVPSDPLAGPQGSAGTDGATGATGATGTAGPAGPQGPAGEPAIKLLVGLISDRVTARRGRAVSFRYLTTAAGTVRLEVLRGRRVVARATGRAAAGRNALRLKARALPRGRYATRLTVTARDGQIGRDTGRLTVSR